MTISSSVFGKPYITTSNKLYVKVTTYRYFFGIIASKNNLQNWNNRAVWLWRMFCQVFWTKTAMSNWVREREKNALQIVHLCLAQSEIAKAFDDGRAVPFVELESDCFVPAWLCIRPVITQAQRDQILYDATFWFFTQMQFHVTFPNFQCTYWREKQSLLKSASCTRNSSKPAQDLEFLQLSHLLFWSTIIWRIFVDKIISACF